MKIKPPTDDLEEWKAGAIPDWVSAVEEVETYLIAIQQTS